MLILYIFFIYFVVCSYMCKYNFDYIFKNLFPTTKVDINYPKESFRNFSISQKGRNFVVQQNNKPFSTIDTANVFRYLQNYKKIHFNIPNYELSKKQCDSLHKTTPFCILKLSEKSGRKTNLRMFRINSSISQENEFGELINQDI